MIMIALAMMLCASNSKADGFAQDNAPPPASGDPVKENPPQQKVEKKKIAVMQFRGDPSSYVTSRVETIVSSVGRWTVVDRNSLSLQAKEATFQSSGATSNQVEFGKLIGADIILTGSYASRDEFTPRSCSNGACSDAFYTSNVTLSFKLLDVTTGEIVQAKDGIEGNGKDAGQGSARAAAFKEATDNFRATFRELFPAEDQGVNLRIIHREGDQVWVRGGRNIGLEKGDVLQSLIQGKQIRDAETGEVLTTTSKVTGKIVLTEVKEKVSVGTIVRGKGDVDSGQILKELPHEVAKTHYWYGSVNAELVQAKVLGNSYYGATNLKNLIGGGLSGGWRQTGDGVGVGGTFSMDAWSTFKWLKFGLEGRYTKYLIDERLSIAPILTAGFDLFMIGKENDFKSGLYYQNRETYQKDSATGYVWQITSPDFDDPSSISFNAGGGAALTYDINNHFSIGYQVLAMMNSATKYTASKSSDGSSSSSSSNSSSSSSDDISISSDFVRYSLKAGCNIRHNVFVEYRW